jgi:NAD(P)-dependent dehydrogenase (short-subunit alcohol dehydrogenase family)
MASKTAIVTGAGSGIGRGCSLALAAEGAAVVCADIDLERALGTASRIEEGGGQALAVHVDVRNEDAVAAMVGQSISRFGFVDVLHNNAGGTDRTRMLGDRAVIGMDLDFWHDVLAVNLDGAFLGCKHVLPHMLERGRGSIINTSSVSGLTGETTRPAYAAAKAGVVSLSRTLAATYGKQGIRVNAIAPGGVLGEGGQAAASSNFLDMMEASSLTPRLGRPEDIANLVVFLASDESAFITGQTIIIDGGMLSHIPMYADQNRILAEKMAQRTGKEEK